MDGCNHLVGNPSAFVHFGYYSSISYSNSRHKVPWRRRLVRTCFSDLLLRIYRNGPVVYVRPPILLSDTDSDVCLAFQILGGRSPELLSIPEILLSYKVRLGLFALSIQRLISPLAFVCWCFLRNAQPGIRQIQPSITILPYLCRRTTLQILDFRFGCHQYPLDDRGNLR